MRATGMGRSSTPGRAERTAPRARGYQALGGRADGMSVNAHLPQLPRQRGAAPAGRVPGQYTRALVRRMRMRALLTLGLFAVFTVVVGRVAGFDHVLFEVAEVALLCVCFAVTRYVLPGRRALRPRREGGGVRRRDPRGAAQRRVARHPRRRARAQQRRPHRPRTGGPVHDRDEEQPRSDQRAAPARAAHPPGPAAAGPGRGAHRRELPSRCSSTAAPASIAPGAGARGSACSRRTCSPVSWRSIRAR